jgi:hypothetical protein
VRAEVRAEPEGAPDSLQDLSGAPPDYLVAQMSEAPTVRIQRPGDVAGAPDFNASKFLVVGAMRQKPSPTVLLVVGAINTPQPPHFNASKFSAFKHLIRAIVFNKRHNQRDQILSQLNCNQDKRHQLCGGPYGDLVSRLIEKRSSLGLSDRLREGNG